MIKLISIFPDRPKKCIIHYFHIHNIRSDIRNIHLLYEYNNAIFCNHVAEELHLIKSYKIMADHLKRKICFRSF